VRVNNMGALLDKIKEIGAGTEYRRGGDGRDTNGNGIAEYDCSGLIVAAMKALGYNL
jgi:hypothetical protein